MNYRYPGPQSFTEEDEGLFFGRKREIKALYDLMMVQSLVVLFAKSGIGKTSLLQAGILPRLRFTEYVPLVIRLNDTATPPEQQLLRKIGADATANSTLWTEILRFNDRENGTLLLIFDQFEELFTLYSDKQREQFVRQLSDVINGTLPEPVRRQIQEGIAAGTLDIADAAALERAPRVKLVLSIRSDMLSYLHLLSDQIPQILRNRFELLGLKPDQAMEAIVNPAAQEQAWGDYASPTFSYSEPALAQILDFLSRRQQSLNAVSRQEPEIESFQLQLLCEHIEKKVAALPPSGEKPVVQPSFYGGEAGIQEVLANFYENALSKIADETMRHLARRLVEDHLIKNERRVGVDAATISITHGVREDVLDKLVETRLLRRDLRETGNYYELSHDTLLPPILQSKATWDAAEAERRALEAAELARREARKRRNAVLVATVAVLSSLVAFYQYRAAERAKLKVIENALEARRSYALALKVEGKYADALKQLDYIRQFASDLEPALRDSVNLTYNVWKQLSGQMAQGDSLARTGDLALALDRYRASYGLAPDNRIGDLIRQTEIEIETRYQDYCFRAERQYKAGQYRFAVENFELALKLKALNPDQQQKLQDARQKLDRKK